MMTLFQHIDIVGDASLAGSLASPLFAC